MTPEQTKLLLDIKFLAEQLQHETTLSKVNQILEIEERISQPEKWVIDGTGPMEYGEAKTFVTEHKGKEYFLTALSDNESDPNNEIVAGKD